MGNFDYKKYLAEGRLLKENTEEEINRVKNIIEKNYNSLISQYVSEGYDENELRVYYDYLLNPNSMGDMGKLEWLKSYSIESLFPSHQTPISERSDNNILEEISPVGHLRRKKGTAKSNDPSFIKAKRGLKQIFQQMLSGELSGKEANDQISDFTFGQGSMGVYPDSNTLFLRQFGMGGGDFNDYVIGKFENGGFTPASQPKNKTALKVWNYLSKLLKEDLTITGEYEGEPVVNSGDELEEYLIDIMSLAVDPDDFVRKVEFGMTDETSRLSREDQAKLVQFYTDNKQHFGSQGKSSPLPSSDYDKVVDGLRSRKIPSRVKLEDSGRINIELGFDFPDSLAGKVFDMLDELGVEADIMAETSARGIKSERINGGPRRDYRREDRDDGGGQDEEWYA
jgi:hypothetical protein